MRRAASSVLVIWLVLSVTFFLIRAAPGGPSALLEDEHVAPGDQRDVIASLGLDHGWATQYVHWLTAALRGRMGTSFTYGKPVERVLASHLPASLLLGSSALLFGFGLGILLALSIAPYAASVLDRVTGFVSLVVYSLPHFWLGMMAILLLSYAFPLLPAGHMHSAASPGSADGINALASTLDRLRHLALPTVVLGAPLAAAVFRLLRSSMIEALSSDYIRTARSKGIPRQRVLTIHACYSALPSVIQLLGLSLPVFLSGLLVTEVVFSWPGLGRLTHTAMLSRDYPLALGATTFTSVLVVLGSLVADVLHASIDPRLRTPFDAE
ncbi:MAG: ABC transporter permease [Acidobacteriota bacterium]|nr:ABC transporter permease [Acidobacteriota bacterium]